MKLLLKKSLRSSLVATAIAGIAPLFGAGCAAAPTVEPTPYQAASRPSASKLDQDDTDAVGFFAAPKEREQQQQQQPMQSRRVSYAPLASSVGPDAEGRVWDQAHRHFAELRGKRGQQALFVDGHRVWPRQGATTFHGQPVWSPDAHGLAVVEEVQRATRLVVMVEYRDPSGDLTWPIPRDAVDPTLKVFWANDSKVVIGETLMRPRFAANWQRLN